MATLTFQGTSVAAVSSANDDGTGGVDLILDQSQDLDGGGNPYYGATDTITIVIDDDDIGPNGELVPGVDGKITVTSILVNGVEILSSPDKIKYSGGADTFEGDAYFFVEGVKLFFLSPIYPNDFSDSTLDGSDLELNVTPRVLDLDIDEDGGIDGGTVEEGNGVFNIYAAESVVLNDLSDGTDDGIITGTQYGEVIYGGPSSSQPDGGLVIDDMIDAGDGNDVVYAGDGDDSVLGGGGDDIIEGGTGADTINAGAGTDTVFGGAGDDLFIDDTSSTNVGYDQQVADLNAIHHWRFEETSGATASDSIGSQNATYLSNTNPNATGVDGISSAVDLSGNNGSNGNGYVEVQHTASMALSEGTFQLWINPDDVSGTSYIFDKYDGNGAQEGLRLYVQDGVLYASITDNYSTQTINTGVSVVSAGDWQHVAITFGDGNLTLYHDGVEVAQTTSSLNLTGNSEELWIGARQDGSWNENHFDGQIDEFAIHDRALTNTEIGQLFTDGPTGGSSAPADPDAYDGGADIDEVDYSGSDEAVSVDLGAGTGTGGAAEGDTYTSIENVTGSAFDDTLTGSSADNTLSGGDGADTISSGTGNDTLDGGAGDDVLTGGGGDDVFVYTGGSDTITDFNTGNSGAINDGDTTNNDSIDLSNHYDTLFELWADQADDGILNQSNTTDTKGNTVDYSDNTQFAPGEGITFTGATADRNSFNVDNTGVVCFTPGTLILTESGELPIESLRPGDRIVTRDNGVQTLQWIANRSLDQGELDAAPKMRPVWIAPDLIGAEAPLLVSPQHGILVRPNGGEEALVRAIHLARLPGGKARIAKGKRNVTYIHLMFDAHQIIFANGAPSESFYPGPMALRALANPAIEELRHIFPELFTSAAEDIYGVCIVPFARFRGLPDSLHDIRAA